MKRFCDVIDLGYSLQVFRSFPFPVILNELRTYGEYLLAIFFFVKSQRSFLDFLSFNEFFQKNQIQTNPEETLIGSDYGQRG